MRLERMQKFLQEKGIMFEYHEVEGLGSIDFLHRGLSYHIWEFDEGEAGAESNVYNAGKSQDYFGDYERTLMDIMKYW